MFDYSSTQSDRRCAVCGAPLPWQNYLASKNSRVVYQAAPMQTRTFAFGDSIPAGANYEHRRPARTATMESDVAVPVLQATLTGLISGTVAACAAVFFHSAQPIIIGLSVGVGSMGIAWLKLLSEHRELLWEIERVTGVDLDRDHTIGEPDDEPTTQPVTHVDVTDKTGRTSQRLERLELPIDPDKLPTLARGLLNGLPFSEAEWGGPGRLMSGPKFRRLQDYLHQHAYIQWRDDRSHTQGVELTGRGRRLFAGLVNPTPLPQGGT